MKFEIFQRNWQKMENWSMIAMNWMKRSRVKIYTWNDLQTPSPIQVMLMLLINGMLKSICTTGITQEGVSFYNPRLSILKGSCRSWVIYQVFGWANVLQPRQRPWPLNFVWFCSSLESFSDPERLRSRNRSFHSSRLERFNKQLYGSCIYRWQERSLRRCTIQAKRKLQRPIWRKCTSTQIKIFHLIRKFSINSLSFSSLVQLFPGDHQSVTN